MSVSLSDVPLPTSRLLHWRLGVLVATEHHERPTLKYDRVATLSYSPLAGDSVETLIANNHNTSDLVIDWLRMQLPIQIR